jgi:uncharacterized membrane protein
MTAFSLLRVIIVMDMAKKDTLTEIVLPKELMRSLRVMAVEAAGEAVVVDVDMEEAILKDKGLKKIKCHQSPENPIPDRKRELHRNGVEFVVIGLGAIALMTQKIVQTRSMMQQPIQLLQILITKMVLLIQMGPMTVGPTDKDLVDSHTSHMRQIFKKPVH